MKQQYCPYIGLENDADTHLTYPSVRHICHRACPKQAVNPAHQQAYCLTSIHHQCPVFLQPVESPLPFELRAFPSRRKPGRRVVLMAVGLVVLIALILVVALGAWGLLAKPAEPSISPSWSPVGLPTSTFSPTPRPIFTATSPVTPALSPSTTVDVASSTLNPPASPSITSPVILAPTARPSLTPGAQACTPPAGWVIYVVRSGDTLYRLAQLYGVSVARLQQANCMGTSTILIAGTRLYVPNVPTRTYTPVSTPAHTLVPTSTATESLPSLTPTLYPTNIPTFTLPPTHTPTASLPTDTPTGTPVPYP